MKSHRSVIVLLGASLALALAGCSSATTTSPSGYSGPGINSTASGSDSPPTTAPFIYHQIGSVIYQDAGATLTESYSIGTPGVVGSSPPVNAPPSGNACGYSSQDSLYVPGQLTLTLTGRQRQRLNLEPYYDVADVSSRSSASQAAGGPLLEDIQFHNGGLWDCTVLGGVPCGCGWIWVTGGSPVVLNLWFASRVPVVTSSRPNFSTSELPQIALLGWTANPASVMVFGAPSTAVTYSGPNATSGCTTSGGRVAGILLFAQAPQNAIIPPSPLSGKEANSTVSCSAAGTDVYALPSGLPAPIPSP
jgi:hypothetical protein